MARRPNGRAIKRHRNYTVDEAARALKIAKGTVRRWLKAGLPALTEQRPALILGRDLIDHLAARKSKRQPCALHHGFCFKCRAPRAPAFGEVEIWEKAHGSVMMRALCEQCATIMHKPISGAQLPNLRAKVSVSVMEAPERIGESRSSRLIDHLTETR